MPRARISKDGIELAKLGYDVDTAAPKDMLFSPDLVAMRLALTGTMTPVAYSGYMSDFYKRAVVDFDDPFPSPPIVMVAGLNGDGTTDQSQFLVTLVAGDGGWLRQIPNYEIQSFTDRFEFYQATRFGISTTPSPRPSTWRYFVFQNTLDT